MKTEIMSWAECERQFARNLEVDLERIGSIKYINHNGDENVSEK